MTSRGDRVAATQPMAMDALANHMVTHQLPGAAEISFPGRLIGEDEMPEVRVVLDASAVGRWLDSLEPAKVDVVMSADGRWYDVHGVASSVRVRLSWLAPSWVRPVRGVRLLDGGQS